MVFTFAPAITMAATCSRANLTRCLDSACAINVSSNPAARCQYCGTSSAGDAPSGGMKAVSVGASAKYNIPDKELKRAPTDAGERYAWATKRCIEIVAGCTPDDVSDTYDELIEQSCTAAGINAQMANLRKNATVKKTQATCQSEISACIMSDKACGKTFANCTNDSDFDKYLSSCGVESGGCDEFMATIRTKLADNRKSIADNAASVLAGIVKSYQDAREKRLNSTRANCENNSVRDTCINTVCNQNMANKCDSNHAEEKSMATLLCKFYETACATLK